MVRVRSQYVWRLTVNVRGSDIKDYSEEEEWCREAVRLQVKLDRPKGKRRLQFVTDYLVKAL